jgi:hypothetical protein
VSSRVLIPEGRAVIDTQEEGADTKMRALIETQSIDGIDCTREMIDLQERARYARRGGH